MNRKGAIFAVLAASLLLSVPIFAQSSERTDHVVQNGRARLEAELVLPADGEKTKGAVVFICGSGAADFRNYIPGFTEQLVESIFLPRDIAVFYFNKDGVGKSAGSWK